MDETDDGFFGGYFRHIACDTPCLVEAAYRISFSLRRTESTNMLLTPTDWDWRGLSISESIPDDEDIDISFCTT